MSLSIYEASVPMFSRMLSNLNTWLEKAEAHAASKKFDVNVLVGTRLAPDMLPFSRQIQIAADTAKKCAARLAGVEAPNYEDNETTIAELKARVQKTIDYIQSIPAAKFEGAETRDVTFPLRGEPRTMKGQAYFLGHATPNFYFHFTTAYALLRHNGVDLGKADVLRGL